MGLAQPRHEDEPGRGPCTDCDCAGMPNGSSDAAFCFECGHAADAHQAPDPQGCGHDDCACPEFDGPAAARFCRGCGHAATEHADVDAGTRHLRVVDVVEVTAPIDAVTTERRELEEDAEPVAAASTALVEPTVSMPAINVTVNTGEVSSSRGAATIERSSTGWMALIVTASLVSVAAVVIVLALQWRAGERSGMASAAERRTTEARQQLAIEKKLGTDLEARMKRKVDDLAQLDARRAKLDAGPKVIGSVAQSKARRDYFKRQVAQREATLARARANADSAIGTVRGW